jgi:hypothetical protein
MNDVQTATSADSAASEVLRSGGAKAGVAGGGVFRMQCFDESGALKWEAEEHNLVVNVGLKDMNDKYFAGSSYTATWYIGLYGAAGSNTPAASDTMASHAGWTEVTNYSQSTRPACSFGSATTADPSVITNSGSAAAFSINATVTVGGAFLTSDNTKGGTSGILFSASAFASPGDRNVVSGDTLTVTYTFSLDAA